jgi:hypothetical protein
MLPDHNSQKTKQNSRIIDGEKKFLRTARKYVQSLMGYTREMDKPGINNTAGNVRKNVTLRRVRATIIAVEKQYVLHILSVSL